MVKRTAFLGAALLAGCLASCGDDGEEGDGPAPGAEAEAGDGDVPFVRKFPPSTSGGFLEPARMVISDPVIWESTWARANAHFAPVPKAPPVDFGTQVVALAALGAKATAGWSVEIVGARMEGKRLRILVAERGPPRDAAAAPVVTNPWHAVVLPREGLPAEWEAFEAPGGNPAGK